jgi:gliding motility-associated protein GldE
LEEGSSSLEPDSSLVVLAAGFFSEQLGFYIVSFCSLGLLLLFSALASAAEVAFFSLSSDDLVRFKAQDDQRLQQIVQMRQRPQRLLATILILNNFINVSIVMLSTYITWELLGSNQMQGLVVGILSLLVTFLIVFFGEVTPKVYATQNAEKVAVSTLFLLRSAEWIFYPFSSLLMQIGNFLEDRIERKGYAITQDAIKHAIEITTSSTTNEEEKAIYDRIIAFGNLTVRQVMRSRLEIEGFEIEGDFHELMDRINKLGYSRLPIYRETIDKIEGILYVKNLLPFTQEDENFEWQKFIKPALFVPENKKIDDLLKDFQLKRVHMAIVVDEYGGTSGLVTLEDIIEEIVGDINDEFDEEKEKYVKINENTYIFEANISLNDFCKIVEVPISLFETVKGESESLAGLLLEINSNLPKLGEVIDFQQFKFSIVAVDKKRIKKVKVQII